MTSSSNQHESRRQGSVVLQALSIPVNWRRPLKQVLVVLHSYVCRQNNWLCLRSAIFENADSGTDEAGPRCQSLPYPRHESKPGPLSARLERLGPKPEAPSQLLVPLLLLLSSFLKLIIV